MDAICPDRISSYTIVIRSADPHPRLERSLDIVHGFPERLTINLVARAAWIQAAKDKSLQISTTHLQSALELVPGVMDIRQNSSRP